MKKSLAWAIILLGSALAGTALILAVLELGKIYSEATDDPMGLHSPEPQQRAHTMLMFVLLGLPGVVVSFAGWVLLIRVKSRARLSQSSPDSLR